MGPEFIYRNYQSKDEGYITPLLIEAFNGWPKIDINCSPKEHWKWKYLDNPYGNSHVSVALHDDIIVGVSCQYPTKIKIGQKWIVGAYAADLCVHKKFRYYGISKKLIEQDIIQRQKHNINLVYFITSIPYLAKFYERDYHKFPYRIANMVRIKDINKHLRYMPVKRANFIKLGYQILKNYYRLENFISRRYKKNQVLTKVNDKLLLLLDTVLAENYQYKFIIDKSSKFLQWRFLDSRSGNYTIKYSINETGLGYIILGVNRTRDNYPIGYVVDLLATPGSNDIVNSLVIQALKYFDELNINTVSCLITKHHPYEKVLNLHGFLDTRVKLNLFTNLNQIDKTELIMNHPPEKIHLTYAAIDSLPVEVPQYAINYLN